MAADALPAALAALGEGEMFPQEEQRRAAALRKACSAVLAVPAEHRPKTLAGLCRALRGCCRVQSDTLDPVALAKALEVPEAVHAAVTAAAAETGPREGCEALEGEPLAQAKRRWQALQATAFAKACTAELARWVISAAVVERRYRPLDMVRALSMLGLVEADVDGGDAGRADCSPLTEAACAAVAVPVQSKAPAPAATSGDVDKVLSCDLPHAWAPAFYGEKGCNSKKLESRMRDEMKKRSIEGVLHLFVKNGNAYVNMKANCDFKTADACLAAIEKMLQEGRSEAERRAKVRQNEIKQRRAEQRKERERRRKDLKQGTSGGNPRMPEFEQRKEGGDHRRKLSYLEKQRTLNRAAAASKSMGMEWALKKGGADKVDEEGVDVRGLRRTWKLAKQMQRAPGGAHHQIQKSAAPKAQTRSARPNREGVAADITEGLDTAQHYGDEGDVDDRDDDQEVAPGEAEAGEQRPAEAPAGAPAEAPAVPAAS